MKTWKDVKEGDNIYYWDKGKLHKQKVYLVHVGVKENHIPLGRNEWHISQYTERIIRAGANDKSYYAHPTVLSLRGEWYDNNSNINYNCLHRFCCLEAAKKWLKMRKEHYDKKCNKLEIKLNMNKRQLNRINEALENI